MDKAAFIEFNWARRAFSGEGIAMHRRIPTVQPVTARPRSSAGAMFFRWLRMAVICGAAIPIGVVGFTQWRSVEEKKIEAALKSDMLSRGMSVDEIERVLRAPASRRRSSTASGVYASKHADLEAETIRELIDTGMSASDIDRLLRAARISPDAVDCCDWTTFRQATRRAKLLRELAQRGRSADEIERLLQMTDRSRRGSTDRKTTRPDNQPTGEAAVEAALRVLLRSGMSREEIDGLLATVLDEPPSNADRTPKSP